MSYTATDSARAHELASRKSTILNNARRVVALAKAEGRDLSEEEQAAVTEATAQIKADDPERHELARKMLAAIMDTGGETPGTDEWGDPVSGPFTAEDAKGFLTAVKSKQAFRTELPVKAALGTGGLNIPASGETVIPGAYPSAAFPLSQLFNVEATNSPVIRFYVLGGATAGATGEAQPKPDSGVTVTPKDVAVAKIATTVRFSDELAEDASFLVRFLQQELVNAVVTTENAQIVAALGAASGISTASGTTATVIDVAATVIASMTALNGAPPAAFVVHPTVLGGIRTAKASGAGSYFIDVTSAAPQALHGVQLVPSMATAAGTAWMVGRSAATVFRRNQITAEVGWDGTDWSTNQRTMRVEERLAVGVVRPTQVTKVSLT